MAAASATFGPGNGGDSVSSNDGNGFSIPTTTTSNSGSGSISGRGDSVAPLRLVAIPGKGRGVVAARKLSPGEPLLVCRPLALVQGPPPATVPQQQRQQQRQQQQGAGADLRSSRQRRSPTAPAAAAATGSARGVNARLGSGAAAGGSGPASPSAVAAAMAVCSEAALVAELGRLPWGPRQAQILAFLYRGAQQSTTSTASRPGPSASAADHSAAAAAGDGDGGCGALPLDLADLADPWDGAWPAGGFRAAGSGAGESSTAAGEPQAAAAAALTHGSGLPAEQLAAAVRLNATGLPSDDVLLARLYDKPNMSFIGLWPAHAMLNHSCAPNAVAVVSGSQLVIRCCAPVPPGGEVVITYSGALGLGPLALRRALLERNHRFRCTCARCTAEEQVPRELAQLWNDIVMLASQQLQPRLVAAATALRASGATSDAGNSGGGSSSNSSTSGNGSDGGASSPGGSGGGSAATAAALPALLDIRAQVAKCCNLFEETLGQLAPSPQEALWLQASMYPLYETRARAAQLLATAAEAAEAAAAAAASPPPSSSPAVGAVPAPLAAESASDTAGAGAAPGAAAVARWQQGPAQGREDRLGSGPGWRQQQQQQHQPIGSGPDRGELGRRLSEEYLEALSACLRLQGVANAGSDMHVQLAARYDTACAAHAARHPGPRAQQLAAEARQRLERALIARYGTPAEAAPAKAGADEATAIAGAADFAREQPEATVVPSLSSLLEVLGQLQHQQKQ